MSLDSTDVTEIRNTFGDEAGFYYAFCSFYLQWLWVLAPMGCCFGALEFAMKRAGAGQAFGRLQLAWAFVIITWATLMLAHWDRKTRTLQRYWDLGNMEGVEHPRLMHTPPARRGAVGWLWARARHYAKFGALAPVALALLLAVFMAVYVPSHATLCFLVLLLTHSPSLPLLLVSTHASTCCMQNQVRAVRVRDVDHLRLGRLLRGEPSQPQGELHGVRHAARAARLGL